MSRQPDLKNLLIVMHEEGDGERSAALAYGLSLAQAARAHLMVQAGSVKLQLSSARRSAAVAGLIAAENRRMRDLIASVADQSRAESAMAGVICETEAAQLTFAELSARAINQARVADIAIVDADPSVLTPDGGLLRAILSDGGRPILVVPKSCRSYECDRVLVAWDGSVAASRAVAGALPFLKAASEVSIVCFVGEKDLSRSAAGADLAVALGRHGVNVSAKDVPAGPDVAARLLEQAAFHKADMIVMGAFVHSPLRQWLFGGVTQAMLGSCPAPLLMAR
jgi:nucleotide-binding universal stress UspA family protein